jgi:hypothetical protein
VIIAQGGNIGGWSLYVKGGKHGSKGAAMKIKHLVALVIVAASTGASFGIGLVAQGAPGPDQMVASLKANLQESQKRLRQYQWIETTVISLKGEEKSRKQEQVYYGADGTLTKLPVGGAPQPQASGGGRGGRGARLKEKIVENKKDEMQDYMERAATLIHLYVPPSPERIQKAKDGGNMLLRPPTQGRVRVEFPEFVQPGDLLAIDVDAAASRLAAVSVKTYLDKPEDAVTLDVRYGTLTDGTSYVAQTTLDAAAKNISVVVQNTGHRPLSAR